MMADKMENSGGSSDQLQQLISQISEVITESELFIEGTEDPEETIAESENRQEKLNALKEQQVTAAVAVERQLHELNLQTSDLLSSHEVKKLKNGKKLEKEVKGLKEKLQLMKVHVEVIGVLLAERAELESTFKNCEEILCLKTEEVNELSCQLKGSKDQLEDPAKSKEIVTEKLGVSDDHFQNLGDSYSESSSSESEVEDHEVSDDDIDFEITESQSTAERKDSPYKCKICGKEFKYRKCVAKHVKSHGQSEGKPHTCKICGKGFKYPRCLRKHMKVHRPESDSDTDFCGEDNSFACDVCGKAFKYKSPLKVHMRKHNGEKPFTCEVCGKGFAQQCGLTTHLRTHTGERPFTCDVCGKGFAQGGDLKTHIKTHSAERTYICDICGKGFKVQKILTSHMAGHTGHKPYLCHVCNRGFTFKHHLVRHLKVHSGAKPYCCKYCGKDFAQSYNMALHVRTQHKDSVQDTSFVKDLSFVKDTSFVEDPPFVKDNSFLVGISTSVIDASFQKYMNYK